MLRCGWLLVCGGLLSGLGNHSLAAGKTNWVDIRTLGVEGRGWTNTHAFYHRLPAKAAGMVPPPVFNLSKHSAGMLVRFVSDAQTIQARWSLTSSNLGLPHMPATGVSGLDLYTRELPSKDQARRGESRNWTWVGVGIPRSQTNTVNLVSEMHPGTREYLLYLPLYNGVQSVELGVAEECSIEPAGPWGGGVRQPIVFYGTSIQQGASATRPGMVHSSILGRRFNWPTINLGFSGNGRMEMAMAELLSELDASVYVLDCLPNMDQALLQDRFEPFVRRLRQSHPTIPIVLVEDRTYANAHLVAARRERNDSSRAVARECFQRLKKEGDKNLYYLKGENLLGIDHEGTVDSSHPNDLGFMRQADAFARVLAPLLKPGK